MCVEPTNTPVATFSLEYLKKHIGEPAYAVRTTVNGRDVSHEIIRDRDNAVHEILASAQVYAGRGYKVNVPSL
jgi:hypothetical protein